MHRDFEHQKLARELNRRAEDKRMSALEEEYGLLFWLAVVIVFALLIRW